MKMKMTMTIGEPLKADQAQQDTKMEQTQVTTTHSTPSIATAPDVDKAKPISKELREILASKDNVCELFDKTELATHLALVTTGIAADLVSMEPYLKKYEKAIQRAKLLPKNETKSFPFEKASNVVMPYLLDAAVDFNARTAPPLLERQDICKIRIIGKDERKMPEQVLQAIQEIAQTQGPEVAQQKLAEATAILESEPTPKQARADRVAEAINYDLTCGIEGWREQQDKALFVLPLVGTYFKKTYQCPVESKRKSELIYPDTLIFDHTSDTFDMAPRKSFEFSMSRNEVVSAVRSGQYLPIEGMDKDKETQIYQFTESHCEMDLDDDGYAEPYIATISKATGDLVSIVPLFDEQDVTMNKDSEVVRIHGEKFFSQTIFLPDPAGTCMGLGYGILLSDIWDVIDTNTNQLIDAGTLQNVGGSSGFIRGGAKSGPRAGNRQKKGTVEITLGKFSFWEGTGNSPLQNDIAQLPFQGPSEALRMLLEQLKVEAREMTATTTMSEAVPGEAAALYAARLHEALVKPTSIMIRVFNGLSKEFKRIFDIQARYLSKEEYAEILDDPSADKEADYDDKGYDIKTTADPSQGSEMERVAKAEAMLAEAKKAPAVFDLRHAYTQWVEAIGGDPEKYLPAPKQGEPDPIAAIQAQAMQTMSEAEMMKGEAAGIVAQTKMISAQIELAKLDTEIEKMESEIIKNYTDADKNEASTEHNERSSVLAGIKEHREALGQMVKAAQGNRPAQAEPATQTLN